MALTVHQYHHPDLLKYPSTRDVNIPGQWSTVGDLHGNALKLLYFMSVRGAVNISKEDYERFAELYSTYVPPDAQKLQAMNLILGKVSVIPGARIREIGDDFSDRGRGDELMLALINQFKTNGGILDTVLSNHTEIFILHIEAALKFATSKNKFNSERFKQSFSARPKCDHLSDKIIRSLTNLSLSVESGAVTPETLIEQYNQYKTSLKAFSYDYDDDGEVIIYSHAGISKAHILLAAQEIEGHGVFNATEVKSIHHALRLEDATNKLCQLTDSHMIPVIDAINRIVALKAQENNLTDLLLYESVESTFLSDFLNNRENPEDNDINNVHGHDLRVYGKRITLDGLCGRENISSETVRDYPELFHLTYLRTHHVNPRLNIQKDIQINTSASTTKPVTRSLSLKRGAEESSGNKNKKRRYVH